MTPWVEIRDSLTTERGSVPHFTVDLRSLRNRWPVKSFRVAEFDREMYRTCIAEGNVDCARGCFVVLESKDAGFAKMVVFPPCNEHGNPITVESVARAYNTNPGMPRLEVVGSGEVLVVRENGRTTKRMMSENLPERNRELKPMSSQTQYVRETLFRKLGGTKNFQLVNSLVIEAYADQPDWMAGSSQVTG